MTLMDKQANKKVVHVAVGVICHPEAAQILIARRPDHLHMGGLWEFPGGKVEPGETLPQALARELHEELDIDVIDQAPLIEIRHDYPDKRVLLDTWWVTEFSGIPRGVEGQETRWVPIAELGEYTFPEANRAILTAILAAGEGAQAG